MRPSHILFVPVALFALLSGQVFSQTTLPQAPGVSIEKGYHYGPLPAENYDACLPTTAVPPLPAVILVHGGFWQYGKANGMLSSGRCQFFALHGIAAFAINYRLYHRRTEKNPWPDQLLDAQLAVRFFRAQAAFYNLDANHICALGDSAGGQLVLFLGSLDTPVGGDVASLYPGISPKASCVVDDFGPADFVALAAIPGVLAAYPTLGPLFYDVPTRRLTTAQLAGISPITRFSDTSAPTLVVQGNADTVVPPSQGQEVFDTLQKDGVATVYLSYDGGHQFSGVSPTAMTRIERHQAQFIASH